MKVLSQMRVAMVDFIYAMSDSALLDKQDIRYAKPNSGATIRKIVTAKDGNGNATTEEIPYQASSNYIVYDLTIDDTSAAEQVDAKITSMLTLRLTINIYGKDVDQQVQTMLAKMSSSEYETWRDTYQYSLVAIPEEIEQSDVFKNQEWWLRRTFDVYFTTHQELALKAVTKLTTINHSSKIID